MRDHDIVALVATPTELEVERVLAEPRRLVVVVRARRREVRCPICGRLSRRVRSHYERCLADLAWHRLAIALTSACGGSAVISHDVHAASYASGSRIPRSLMRGAPRRAAWLLSKPAATLTAAPERAYIEAVCAACPALAVVRDLVAELRRLLTTHDVTAFHPWLAAVQQSELHSLAMGLQRDADAVLAALHFPWSNGQVEGQVNRLKLVKRTMYGRASYALLRRRLLAA